MGRPVPKNLDLDIPFRALAPHVEFNPNIAGQSPKKPKRMILGPFHMELPVLNPPVAAGVFIGGTQSGAFEVVSEAGAYAGIALRGTGCKQDTRQGRHQQTADREPRTASREPPGAGQLRFAL